MLFESMQNTLMIGAHFDDVELGAGGVAALLTSQNKKVYKLTLTDNVTRCRQLGLDISYESSQDDSSRAVKHLGVEEILHIRPSLCNYLDYSTEKMQEIEKVIYEKKIDTVFCHLHQDINRDHVASSALCQTAARHCRNVLMFQSNLYLLPVPYYPSVFFDISKTIEKKKEALGEYRREHNRYDNLFQMVIKRNEIWGFQNKVKYAEGFLPLKLMLGE